jgi:hypothetical protein
MNWNDTIREQLSEYILNPAVVMSPDEEPYEYRENNGSINRFKRRRCADEIPYQLFTFLLERGISKNQLREFGSGLFLNYVETTKIYV